MRKKTRGKPRRPNQRKERRKPKRKKLPQQILTGTIQKNPRGFAFILPSSAEIEDVYVGRKDAKKLLSRDQVEFTVVNKNGKRSAKILKIVKRGQTKFMGFVEERYGKPFVVTDDGMFALLLPNRTNPPLDQFVIASIESFPSEKGVGTVKLVKVLGENLGPEHDLEVTKAQFGLPEGFPKAVIETAKKQRLQKSIQELKKTREDLRNIPFVTIDGEDAKDFDDAVAVEHNPQNGDYRLFVSIADVSHYVQPDSPLDKEASARATSIYFPGHCIPMLPEILSNDLCSLRPQKLRLTMTAEMLFNKKGEVKETNFYQSFIQTKARITYKQLQDFYDNKKGHKLSSLKKPLDNLLALYVLLSQKRADRGTLDFELPECQIEVDKNGAPVAMAPAVRLDSHRLIEEFMIAANTCVAKELKETNMQTLYRIHEPPDVKSLEDINPLLKSFGISNRITKISPKAFSEVLERTKNKKGSKTLHQLILRAQKQACYDPAPKGHFGLALKDYAHFTSPIRRYPDLIVHRSLKTLLGGKKKRSLQKGAEYYVSLADHTSSMERKAVEAERFIVKRKQCWFMLDRLDEKFDGRISSITPNGIYVEIPEFALEGFMAPSDMKYEYELDPDTLCLYQRPGKGKLRIGDPISIVVLDVNPEANQISFRQD